MDTLILQVSSILLKTNVQAGHGCVSRGNEDLLLENDTVLGRKVSISVLDRLTSYNLVQFQVLLVRVNVDLD